MSLPSVTRRSLLATSTTTFALLAGCSASGSGDDGVSFERIIVRTETGQMERVELTLSYAPRDSAAERPVRGVFEVPASGEPLVVDAFEGTAGFYCLSAFSERHDTHEMYSVNSYGPSVESTSVQFEVLIREDGGIWLNLGEADSAIEPPE